MSSPRARYKELLRSLFKGDAEEAQRIADELGDASWEGTGQLVMAVFGVAVDRRFKEDSSHAAVMGFVGELSETYSSAEVVFNPLYAELLLRSALGEDQLFQQVPGDEATALMVSMADKIVVDLGLSDDEIDELLDEAEALIA